MHNASARWVEKTIEWEQAAYEIITIRIDIEKNDRNLSTWLIPINARSRLVLWTFTPKLIFPVRLYYNFFLPKLLIYHFTFNLIKYHNAWY